jgi:hypothetical protein
LISGIKRLERNPAVLASLRLWAQTINRESLLSTQRLEYLAFGDLLMMEIEAGINDTAWQQSEEPSEKKVFDAEANELFEKTP